MAAIAYPDLLPHPPSRPIHGDDAPLASVLVLRRAHRLPRGVYLRRRLVAASALALVIAALFVVVLRAQALLAGPGPVPVAASNGPAVTVSDLGSLAGGPVPANAVYVVRPGDSLWRVARELRPDGDPRPLVDHLVRLNGGDPLVVGERLRLS